MLKRIETSIKALRRAKSTLLFIRNFFLMLIYFFWVNGIDDQMKKKT